MIKIDYTAIMKKNRKGFTMQNYIFNKYNNGYRLISSHLCANLIIADCPSSCYLTSRANLNISPARIKSCL